MLWHGFLGGATVIRSVYGFGESETRLPLQSRVARVTILGAYGDVAATIVVEDDDDLILISSDGIIIRIPVEGISVFSRPSKGVRLMRVTSGERLVTVTTAQEEDDEDNDEDYDLTENDNFDDSENSTEEEEQD